MTQRPISSKPIVIPQILHHQFEPYRKEQEDTKPFNDHKFYISPNRESRPLGLSTSKGFSEVGNQQRIQPSFDNFSLSSMFCNKILAENELAVFKGEIANDAQYLETPLKKIQNEESDFKSTEKAMRYLHGQTKKSRPREKGLRQLSQRAYQIVLNMRSASYKEVANKLVDELNSEKDNDLHIIRSRIEEKDEQNIKRRVYDALNVLIALGVLRKEGRKIVGDRAGFRLAQLDRNNIISQIQAKSQQIERKKQELTLNQTKYKLLPLLMQQNSSRVEECKSINFPFMFLDDSGVTIRDKVIDGSGNCCMMNIANKNPINIKMDLDCYVQYKMESGKINK